MNQDGCIPDLDCETLDQQSGDSPDPEKSAQPVGPPVLTRHFRTADDERTNIALPEPGAPMVVTPVLGTEFTSAYETTDTGGSPLRDPESLLLSIINLDTEPLPQKSTLVPTPMSMPRQSDTVQHILPSNPMSQPSEKETIVSLDASLPSIQVSPIPEKKGIHIRPTTAIEAHCGMPVLSLEDQHLVALTMNRAMRCMSAKDMPQYSDSLFASEPEQSCATPRFLHVLPLQMADMASSPSHAQPPAAEVNMNSVPSLHSSRLQALSHADSSVISTVNVPSTSSPQAAKTPSAALSARMDSLTNLHITDYLDLPDLERILSQEAVRSPIDVIGVCSDIRNEGAPGHQQMPVPVPQPGPSAPNRGSHTRESFISLQTDMNISGATSLLPSQPDSARDIAKLRFSEHICEADKLSARSITGTENIRLDLLLNECSSARYAPSMWQAEQSFRNYEPDQLFLIAPQLSEKKTPRVVTMLEPLSAIAGPPSATDLTASSTRNILSESANPQARADESTSGDLSIAQLRAQSVVHSASSARAVIRPIQCDDPAFNEAHFRFLAQEADNTFYSGELSFSSLPKIHTSTVIHDSSIRYSSQPLTKSMINSRPFSRGVFSSQRGRFGTVNFAPARKQIEVSLIQLDQCLDSGLNANTTPTNASKLCCRSSGNCPPQPGNSTRPTTPSSVTVPKVCRPSSVQLNTLRKPRHSEVLADHPDPTSRVKSGLMGHSNRSSTPQNVQASTSNRASSSGARTQRMSLQRTPKLSTIMHSSTTEANGLKNPNALITNHREIIRPKSQSTQRLNITSSTSRSNALEDAYSTEVRQSIARICSSNTDTVRDKYRTVPLRQRLMGLQPLVRGSVAITEPQ